MQSLALYFLAANGKWPHFRDWNHRIKPKVPDIIGRLFPTRLDIHGHDARSMSDQAASADNDAFAGLPCFGIVSKRVIAHFLLYLKPPGLLAFLLRDGFVNINRHMKSTFLNVKLPFFLI